MEFDSQSTSAWFLDRSKRTTPKRLRKVPLVEVERKGGRGNIYKNTKTGYRKDIDIVCRSGWEADFMRVLKSFSIPFAYEPFIFPFPIKTGNKSYRPDLYLPNTDEYVEIKGYFDNNSRIKIKRWKKYYPEEFATLTMIINKFSKEAIRICRDLGVPNILFFQDVSQSFRHSISNWETSS